MFARLLFSLLCSLSVLAERLEVYTEDFPPFNMADEHGQPTGYAVELLHQLMQEAKLAYQLNLVPWARALTLGKQVPDTLVLTMARTEEREPFFHWIGPIASRSTVLVRLRDSPFKVASLEEAKRYRVGVINGDAGMELLSGQGFVRGGNMIIVNKRNDLIRLLQLKSVDFVVASPSFMHYVATRAGLSPAQLQIDLTLNKAEDGFYFGLNRQSDPVLAPRLQAAWQRLAERRQVATLKRKYQIE